MGVKLRNRPNRRRQTIHWRDLCSFSASSSCVHPHSTEIERRLTAQEMAQSEEVGPARNEKGGRPKKDENLADGYLLPKGSHSAARLVARLKRDAPEFAKRLADGGI